MDVSNSKDDFKIFNQPLSPKVSTGDLGHPFSASTSPNQEVTGIPDEMGIQHKQRSTLQELLES